MEIVNGYVCDNCTDVANARRNIDPAHPKDGPDGVNAPEAQGKDKAQGKNDVQSRGEAVVFGGQLAGLDPSSNSHDGLRQTKAVGGLVDIGA